MQASFRSMSFDIVTTSPSSSTYVTFSLVDAGNSNNSRICVSNDAKDSQSSPTGRLLRRRRVSSYLTCVVLHNPEIKHKDHLRAFTLISHHPTMNSQHRTKNTIHINYFKKHTTWNRVLQFRSRLHPLNFTPRLDNVSVILPWIHLPSYSFCSEKSSLPNVCSKTWRGIQALDSLAGVLY